METKIEPLRGMAIIYKLLEVKEQAQRDFEEALRSDPETQAVYERLEKKLEESRARK
jgi:GrpB-like predicted nucleotidyltransferase (UPF0157 family)